MLQCPFFAMYDEEMRTAEQQDILNRFNAQTGFSYQKIGLNALQQQQCEDLILFLFLRVQDAHKQLAESLEYLGAIRDGKSIVRAGNLHTAWSHELTAVEAEYKIFKDAFKAALDPTVSPEPVIALMSFLGEFSACLTSPEARPSILPRLQFGFFSSSSEHKPGGPDMDITTVASAPGCA